MASRPGATVILQRHRADGWHNERFKPLSAASTVMFRVQPDRRGTFTYRVRRPGDAVNTQGLSRELALRVR